MGGKKSQRKGAAGERELAAILQEYGYDCTRAGHCHSGRFRICPASLVSTLKSSG